MFFELTIVTLVLSEEHGYLKGVRIKVSNSQYIVIDPDTNRIIPQSIDTLRGYKLKRDMVTKAVTLNFVC